MIDPRGRAFLVLALAGALLEAAACGGKVESGSDGDDQEPTASGVRTADTASAPVRAALPGLFRIMAGMEQDMALASRGLWSERFDTIRAGASAVAGHPAIPPAEVARISEVLGAQMQAFEAMDMRVHDLATAYRETAARGELGAAVKADAELRAGCVACHGAFRERIRAALR